MKALFLVLSALLLSLGSRGNSQNQKAVSYPPATVLSKAWMMLAEQGPITNNFTKAAIQWKDGAFYMHIDAGQKRRWKLMLTPPLRDMDWRVQILSPKVVQGQAHQGPDNHKDPRVDWSRSFAKAIPHLPALYTDVATFQVRAVPKQERVVFFLEIGTPPAWITFTVKPSGEFVPLDRGF
jgi:hypothetical protein